MERPGGVLILDCRFQIWDLNSIRNLQSKIRNPQSTRLSILDLRSFPAAILAFGADKELIHATIHSC
jgi:hypothetical protein